MKKVLFLTCFFYCNNFCFSVLSINRHETKPTQIEPIIKEIVSQLSITAEQKK